MCRILTKVEEKLRKIAKPAPKGGWMDKVRARNKLKAMNNTVKKETNGDFTVTPNEVYTDLESTISENKKFNPSDKNWIIIGEDGGGWVWWNKVTGSYCGSDDVLVGISDGK